jgi:hypothetical protein
MKIIIILITSLALSVSAFSQKLQKTYYDLYNTKIQSEYYTNAYGEKVGTFKGYSKFGGILLQGSYKDGAPIGKWTENYENGKLHFIRIFDTPGNGLSVINGKIIWYYEDGKTIKQEKNLKNGDYDGVYKEYDEKGTLTLEGIYVKGVFEPTGESKRIYEEKQALKEKETLRRNKEEYNKIIQEADKAYVAKNFQKALELYKEASALVNEEYPKDKISATIEKFAINSKFIYDYGKSEEYNTLIEDFNTLKANFKIKSVKVYSNTTYTYYEQTIRGLSDICNCEEPWNEEYAGQAFGCFEKNKEFYEPYQRAITESFFKYKAAFKKEIENANNLYVRFNYENKKYEFSTYDKTTFLNNLKETKENFELSKSLKTNYLKALENKVNITKLNEQNKKKTLFNKYIIVYEGLISKINAYPGLSETISLLTSLSSISDKVAVLYSQETKDLEKKLKDAETPEQIQAIILGQ